MKRTILILTALLCLATARAQLTDTITHRHRPYYYSQWYDTCGRYYVQTDSTDRHDLIVSPIGSSWKACAVSDYTPAPMKVLGVAVMVRYLDHPEWVRWADTNYAPEYVSLGYWDDSTSHMQVLDSARWDTVQPKTMKWQLSATPEYYPAGPELATRYFRVYEAYFEKPVTVDSVFYIIGTLNSNRPPDTIPSTSTYMNRELVYVTVGDGGHEKCAPLNPRKHTKLRYRRSAELWYPSSPYQLESSPRWGPFLPIVGAQGRLEAESADSAMGSVHGGNSLYPDGTQVTIEAVPEYGYLFSHWNDGDTANPRQVLMAGDTHFVAYFREAEFYHIAVSALPEDAGTVSGGGHQPERTDITLEAVPSGPQYRFVRWYDGSTDNPRVVRVHSDTSFTALFGVDSSAFEGIGGPEGVSLFTLTPNPARESVTVTLEGAALPAEITVYDAAGHAVLERRAATRRTRLSTRSLPAGHYFVTVATPRGTATQKLTIL